MYIAKEEIAQSARGIVFDKRTGPLMIVATFLSFEISKSEV